MSSVFCAPVGLRQPTGTCAPAQVQSPWPLAPPPQVGRPARSELRAVHRALGSVTMSPGDPMRLLLAEDNSGSMTPIAGLREAVLRGLLRWSQTNLGGEDEIAVIAFGGDACIRRSPSPARDKIGLTDPALRSYATMLGPTWHLASTFRRTDKPTLAVLISDGLVADLTGAGGQRGATAAGIDSTALLIPSEGSFTGGVPASWTAAFPDSSAEVVDAGGGTHLAAAVVNAIATLTGRTTRGIGTSAAPHKKETMS